MDDLFDEWEGIDWGSTPSVDTGVDLSGFDWGNVDFGLGNLDFGGIDLSGLQDFGFDLSSLGDIGSVDLSGLSDWGADVGIGDLGISGFADLSDQIYGGVSGGTYGETSPTDAEAQEGGFYGNIPGQAEYDPRTNSTMLYNPDGSIRDMIVHDERIYDVEQQPGGFYGNTPNATYDPKTNTTTIRNDQGEITKTVYHSPSGGVATSGKTGIEKLVEDAKKIFSGGKEGKEALKDNAMLMALLGGLMGLLSKGSAPKGPVGYQGGIPKYTAKRVPGRGVEYTRAAQGGLMGLKQGQYLDGATDGMADKIQTSIEGKQPARLSHGEFVIPADVVSHLGNGNSDAGADVLYEMMAKVRKARTGTPKQGKQINPRKMIPA